MNKKIKEFENKMKIENPNLNIQESVIISSSKGYNNNNAHVEESNKENEEENKNNVENKNF